MRQNASKVRKKSFINRKDAFCRDSLVKTVEDAFVEVTCLVIHSGHNCIYNTVSSQSCFTYAGKYGKEKIPGGCITQHTTNPDAVLLAKCKAGPSSIPKCLVKRRLAKKYVGS